MTDPLSLPTYKVQRGHSRWAPSASERWFKCEGSLQLIDQLGPAANTGSSIYAEEGTAMHMLAEMCLKSGLNAHDFLEEEINGFTMERDHTEAVDLYVNAIRDDWLNDGGELLIEQPFGLDDIWPGLFGKNDAMLLSRNLLRIYDLKGGKGVPVEVAQNSQLSIYALGALRSLKTYQIDEIELVIVQPRRPHRDGPVRRWRIAPTDLALDFTSLLLERLKATEAPDAPLHAGEHCIFCPARGQCPELRRHALDVLHADFEGNMPAPTILTPAQIGTILHEVDLLDEFVRAVKARAQQLAESGTEIPGWKLVPKRAMRKWLDEETVPTTLAARFGLGDHEIYKRKLQSPAGVDKCLTPTQRAQLAEFYTRVSSGNNFVPIADTRAGVRPAITSDFTIVKEGEGT